MGYMYTKEDMENLKVIMQFMDEESNLRKTMHNVMKDAISSKNTKTVSMLEIEAIHVRKFKMPWNGNMDGSAISSFVDETQPGYVRVAATKEGVVYVQMSALEMALVPESPEEWGKAWKEYNTKREVSILQGMHDQVLRSVRRVAPFVEFDDLYVNTIDWMLDIFDAVHGSAAITEVTSITGTQILEAVEETFSEGVSSCCWFEYKGERIKYDDLTAIVEVPRVV